MRVLGVSYPGPTAVHNDGASGKLFSGTSSAGLFAEHFVYRARENGVLEMPAVRREHTRATLRTETTNAERNRTAVVSVIVFNSLGGGGRGGGARPTVTARVVCFSDASSRKLIMMYGSLTLACAIEQTLSATRLRGGGGWIFGLFATTEKRVRPFVNGQTWKKNRTGAKEQSLATRRSFGLVHGTSSSRSAAEQCFSVNFFPKKSLSRFHELQ